MKTRILGFLLLATLIIMPGSAVAASCSNSANYGTVGGNLTIPMPGDYILWSRIYVPDTTNNTYQLEVDGTSCFQVGGSSTIKANTWTWIDYQNGNATSKVTYNFKTAGSHSVTLIGAKPGVIVDKIIALGSSETCGSNGSTPKDSGDNCASGTAVTVPSSGAGNSTGATGTTPAGSTPQNPVKGTYIPPILAQITSSTDGKTSAKPVAKVEYYVNNKLVQTNTGAGGLDTTLIPDGKQEVTTKVTFTDGSTVTGDSTVYVDNVSTPREKTEHFVSQHRPIILPSFGIAVLLAGAVALYIVRKIRKHHRYLIAHGMEAPKL
jgi:hypothetical protein